MLNFSHYKKKYVYDFYSKVVQDPIEYKKITKNKMLSLILDEIDKDPYKLLSGLNPREVKELFELTDSKTKISFDLYLSHYNKYGGLFITEIDVDTHGKTVTIQISDSFVDKFNKLVKNMDFTELIRELDASYYIRGLTIAYGIYPLDSAKEQLVDYYELSEIDADVLIREVEDVVVDIFDFGAFGIEFIIFDSDVIDERLIHKILSSNKKHPDLSHEELEVTGENYVNVYDANIGGLYTTISDAVTDKELLDAIFRDFVISSNADKISEFLMKVPDEYFVDSIPEGYTMKEIVENAHLHQFCWKLMGHKRAYHKVGRNSPCPCGSGKKYKKCCG